jgi:hypothetical protein
MARAMRAFQILGRAVDLNPRRKSLRIQLARGGSEAEIDARGYGQALVLRFGARIAREIRRIAELARVDSARDDNVRLRRGS